MRPRVDEQIVWVANSNLCPKTNDLAVLLQTASALRFLAMKDLLALR